MTLQTNWQKQPSGIIHHIFAFLDPLSGYSLAGVDKRTRDVFFHPGFLEQLIDIHFHCAPSRALSPIDHHRALTIASTSHSISLLSEPGIQLTGPFATNFKISNDLTRGLSTNQETLFLWNLTNGQLLHTFAPHMSDIESCHLSQDDAWALTQTLTEIKIWDLEAKICLQTITEKKLLEAQELYIIHDADQRKVLAIYPFEIQVWDLQSEKYLLNIQVEDQCLYNPSPVTSPDGKTVLLCFFNGDLLLYNLITGKCLKRISTENPWVDCLAISATKAYSTLGPKIKIWDLATGRLVQTIETPSIQMIEHLQISADEKKIISTNSNGIFSIWHQPTGKLLETIERVNQSELASLQMSADGTRALLANHSLGFRVLHLAPLPHHRIYDTAMLCLQNDKKAKNYFKELPSFITKDINMDIPTFPNLDAYNRLCEYSKTDLLPEIANLFLRSENAKSNQDKQYFSTPAFHRFHLLPPDTRKFIYDRLALIHEKTGKLRQHKTPAQNYGEQAFNNNPPYSATHKERYMAIKDIVSPAALASGFSRKFLPLGLRQSPGIEIDREGGSIEAIHPPSLSTQSRELSRESQCKEFTGKTTSGPSPTLKRERTTK